MKYLFPIFYLFLISGCQDSSDESGSLEITNRLSYIELIQSIGEEKLTRTVEVPDVQGALGRNKSGYFHVRFQMPMSSLTDFAVVTERADALAYFLDAVDYAFGHQLEDGTFELSVPTELMESPDYNGLSEGDLASATVFFSYGLGLSLMALSDSEWFQNSPETEPCRTQLATYKSSIEKTLDYLLESESLLNQYDATAPNRLIFDALAYFTLGKYLNKIDAIILSKEFLNLALELTDPEEGYFIENGGWDSSYNGVALQLIIELVSLMEYDGTEEAEGVIRKAALWQASRILDSGEISTEGNTRVFPGGESFLGTEKGVDYVKTLRALLYFSYLSDNAEINQLTENVLEFYQ